MFGPYRLSHGKHLIAEQFDAAGEDDWEPPYNIAPTQPVPITCQHPKEPRPERSLVRWGLIDEKNRLLQETIQSSRASRLRS